MRNLLLSLVLTFAAIPVAYACSMGMSVHFVEGLPQGFELRHSIANKPQRNIKRLVRRYLQRTDWRYAAEEYFIQAAEIAENSAVVPVSIKNAGTAQVLFERVVILLEKRIQVLDPQLNEADISNRNRQLPIDYQIKTLSASLFIEGASYRFPSGSLVMSLSQRFNLTDAESVNVLVLMEPLDKSKPVQVIYHNEPIRIHSCDTTIYVDGPVPEWAKRGYYYF